MVASVSCWMWYNHTRLQQMQTPVAEGSQLYRSNVEASGQRSSDCSNFAMKGKRSGLPLILIAAMLALTACGQVVTPQPTVRTFPTSTPTPAHTPTFRPTATAPFTPPPATATPTVTPTPVTHVVKEGETLLSIAFEYGVSLQALQTVNSIENPQFLQVGQTLFIPTGEEEAGTTSGLLLPTPTPLPFGVEGLAFYETPVGSLWCLGEIVNTTESTLTNVKIHVTLFNASGEPQAEADAFTAADVIPPDERSPFGILFTTPPEDWANPQVTVVRGEAAGALDDAYVPIAIAELDGQSAGPQFQVTGVVQNADEEQAADAVSVIVTTYDAQGLVTGFRRADVEQEGPLAPGAAAPFTLLLTYHGEPPADFYAVALGRVPVE
jgi:LysM repeat protein